MIADKAGAASDDNRAIVCHILLLLSLGSGDCGSAPAMTTWGKTTLKVVIADLIRDLLHIGTNSY